MSRSLDDLCPFFEPYCYELIARCASRRVWLLILDTLRTPEEQEENLRKGVSKTRNSLHLPQRWCNVCQGLSHAMDAAPIRDLQETNLVKAIQWDPKHPSWQVYGEEAKKLGLVWGGSWGWDFSHIQVPKTLYTSEMPVLPAKGE